MKRIIRKKENDKDFSGVRSKPNAATVVTFVLLAVYASLLLLRRRRRSGASI